MELIVVGTLQATVAKPGVQVVCLHCRWLSLDWIVLGACFIC